MEPIINKTVATATDIALNIGTRGGGTGTGLRSDPPAAVTDPVGFSTDLANGLYEVAKSCILTIYKIANTIMGNPYLLIVFGIMALGFTIGIFGRMLKGD